MAFNSILRKSSYFVMPFVFAGLLKKNKDSLAPMFHFSSVVVKQSPPPMRKMTTTALQYNNYHKMKGRKIEGGIWQVEGSQNCARINSLARFAIDEHNKKENAILEFVKVVNAKQQLVSGWLYYITLEAKDGEKMNVYEAKIWVQSWLDFKKLQDFKLVVGDAPSVDSAM